MKIRQLKYKNQQKDIIPTMSLNSNINILIFRQVNKAAKDSKSINDFINNIEKILDKKLISDIYKNEI